MAVGLAAPLIEHRDPFALLYARTPIVGPLRAHRCWPELAARMKLPAMATERPESTPRPYAAVTTLLRKSSRTPSHFIRLRPHSLAGTPTRSHPE
jgi:hypothetical protein